MVAVQSKLRGSGGRRDAPLNLTGSPSADRGSTGDHGDCHVECGKDGLTTALVDQGEWRAGNFSRRRADPEPRPDLVRIEATPINPSDLGLLTGAADFSTIKASGTKDHPIISAKVPEAAMPAMAKWPKASSGSGSPIRC